MNESADIKIRCKSCRKKFSGARQRLAAIAACPACGATGDWQSSIADESGAGPVIAQSAPDNIDGAQSPVEVPVAVPYAAPPSGADVVLPPPALGRPALRLPGQPIKSHGQSANRRFVPPKKGNKTAILALAVGSSVALLMATVLFAVSYSGPRSKTPLESVADTNQPPTPQPGSPSAPTQNNHAWSSDELNS